MCSTVIDKLRYIKKQLEGNEDSIIFAEFSEGGEDENILDNPNLKEFKDFIKFSNGARYGSIDLWSIEDLPKKQFYIQEDIDTLLCIGQILYEPIVISKKDGNLFLFDTINNSIDYDKNFGSFNNFLDRFVLGDKYGEIIPEVESDEWYLFLKEIKIL